MQAWSDADFGQGQLKAQLDYTRGERKDGGDLYHIMPPSLTLRVEQSVGAWSNAAEIKGVARKSRVDDRRLEDNSAGYALINLATRVQVNRQLSFSAGVRNLFDRAYVQPLGGVNLAAFKAAPMNGLLPLQGQGRSFDVGMNVLF